MNRVYSSARSVLLVVGVSALTATTFTKAQLPPKVALEIRSYTLKPGTRAAFHQRFVTDSLPLLHRWGIDVVAYGPSQHDDVTYYLMRAFPSRAERDRVEAAFYASAEWQNGPRAAVLGAIDTFTTVLIDVDQGTIGGLRHVMETSAATTDYAIIVHARTTFSLDGRRSNGRYTDVWARRGGVWLAVAAHVTRN